VVFEILCSGIWLLWQNDMKNRQDARLRTYLDRDVTGHFCIRFGEDFLLDVSVRASTGIKHCEQRILEVEVS
jgi:hypothetical protein